MDVLVAQGIASLSLPVAAMITIMLPIILAIGLGVIIHSVFTPQELAANAAVGYAKFGFLTEVYAVIAALTLVGAWDIYQNSRDIIQRETNALYMLALATEAYTGPDQAELRAAMRFSIRNYASEVVGEEWAVMQGRGRSENSETAFQLMANTFMRAEPITNAQQALAQNIPQWISNVAETRLARLSIMSRTISSIVWTLLLATSVAVLAFQWFFGGSRLSIHYAMGVFISVIIGGVLLTCVKLAFPFSGEYPLLSTRPFLILMEVR
jgi:hypothetical protein